ncbi:hypothetical protein S40293_04024 [Stachybotrys chartarum IBT 40293]|nr:hypothetical protein S40293_04024 [Stachybotrys chartarum IBT 40293]
MTSDYRNLNVDTTADIWHQVTPWSTSEMSSLLNVQGDYNSAQRVARFGAELVKCIDEQSLDACAIYRPVPQSIVTPFRISGWQILRHIAIQALRKAAYPPSLSHLVDLVADFRTAVTCKGWFDVLEKILPCIPGLYIVIHLGTVDAAREAYQWPQEFHRLIQKVNSCYPQVVVKVALITCSPLLVVHDRSMTNLVVRALRSTDPLPAFALYPANRWKNIFPIPSEGCNVGNRYSSQRDDSNAQIRSRSDVVDPTDNQVNTSTLSHYETWNFDKPRNRQDFGVAIFCAIPREADAVIALFDKHWNRKEYGKAHGDTNSYTLGAINNYNVVLVHLPGMGKGIAASAASSCRASFTGFRLVLVVGICGGVPFGPDGSERILGDVAISDGIVQYDLGRQFPHHFVRKNSLQDNLSRPNVEIRGFLARLSSQRGMRVLKDAMEHYMTTLRACKDIARDHRYEYPGAATDILYDTSLPHTHQDAAQCPAWPQTCSTGSACDNAEKASCESLLCHNCDDRYIIRRERLAQALSQSPVAVPKPAVHIGAIASGDKVMKSGGDRDRIARNEGIIAYEMEGAGVWDHYPCLIIKSICDYADCHKGKMWQDYAAATAAACMKAVLEQWD